MESARADIGVLAHKAGFTGQQALLVATQRYLPRASADNSTRALPSYRDALRQIVDALGGRLASDRCKLSL